MFLEFRRNPKGLIFAGVLVLLFQFICISDSNLVTAAFAESEASSEASSESGGGGGRGRRGYWRYQQQQQSMAARQARKQQQMQAQAQQRQNAAAARQRNKPFKVSDYIHEYGSGKSKANFQRRNFSSGNIGNAAGQSASGGQSAQSGGGNSLGNLPGTNSVPFQKFPPK